MVALNDDVILEEGSTQDILNKDEDHMEALLRRIHALETENARLRGENSQREGASNPDVAPGSISDDSSNLKDTDQKDVVALNGAPPRGQHRPGTRSSVVFDGYRPRVNMNITGVSPPCDGDAPEAANTQRNTRSSVVVFDGYRTSVNMQPVRSLGHRRMSVRSSITSNSSDVAKISDLYDDEGSLGGSDEEDYIERIFGGSGSGEGKPNPEPKTTGGAPSQPTTNQGLLRGSNLRKSQSLRAGLTRRVSFNENNISAVTKDMNGSSRNSFSSFLTDLTDTEEEEQLLDDENAVDEDTIEGTENNGDNTGFRGAARNAKGGTADGVIIERTSNVARGRRNTVMAQPLQEDRSEKVARSLPRRWSTMSLLTDEERRTSLEAANAQDIEQVRFSLDGTNRYQLGMVQVQNLLNHRLKDNLPKSDDRSAVATQEYGSQEQEKAVMQAEASRSIGSSGDDCEQKGASRTIRSLSLANPHNSSIQSTINSIRKVQLMNLSLTSKAEKRAISSEATGIEAASDDAAAFSQFSLLSIDPKTYLEKSQYLSQLGGLMEGGQRYLDPFIAKSADPLDMFPASVADDPDSLSPKALSHFCFPDGLKMRLIPRCAMAGAKRLQWVGQDADRYHLLAFTDGSGQVSHGVAITIREEIGTSDDDADALVSSLVAHRRRRSAVAIIARWLRKCLRRRHALKEFSIRNISDQKSRRNLVNNDTVRRASLCSAVDGDSSVDEGKINVGMSKDSSNSKAGKKSRKITSKLKRIRSVSDDASMGSLSSSRSSIANTLRRGRFRKKRDKEKSDKKKVDKMSIETVLHSSMIDSNSSLHLSKLVCVLDKESMTSIPGSRSNLNDGGFRASIVSAGRNAYQHMVDSDRCGDVCVVEKCYVCLGGKQEEQFMLLAALQQMIDLERRDNALYERGYERSDPRTHGLSCMKWFSVQHLRRLSNEKERHARPKFVDHRHKLLAVLQAKLRLSREQARCSFPKSELEHIVGSREKFVLSFPLVRDFGKIALPLPLPHCAGDWGFSRLLLKIEPDQLVNIVMLLLLERSVLVLGEGFDEVTSCCCALLKLLEPYEWASTFMPLLPRDMLDFVNSPVPFVAGMALESDAGVKAVRSDYRIKEAMQEGLSVVDLSTGTLQVTNEAGIKIMLDKCSFPKKTQLSLYQARLEVLAKEESSGLLSFKRFLQCGLSPKESVTLHAAKTLIKNYLKGLSGALSERPDGWQEFGKYNEATHNFDFYPSWFVEPLREQLQSQLQFQEMMVHTQLFIEFVEQKRNEFVEQNELGRGRLGLFIAEWVYFRWTLKKKHKGGVIRSC